MLWGPGAPAWRRVLGRLLVEAACLQLPYNHAGMGAYRGPDMQPPCRRERRAACPRSPETTHAPAAAPQPVFWAGTRWGCARGCPRRPPGGRAHCRGCSGSLRSCSRRSSGRWQSTRSSWGRGGRGGVGQRQAGGQHVRGGGRRTAVVVRAARWHAYGSAHAGCAHAACSWRPTPPTPAPDPVAHSFRHFEFLQLHSLPRVDGLERLAGNRHGWGPGMGTGGDEAPGLARHARAQEAGRGGTACCGRRLSRAARAQARACAAARSKRPPDREAPHLAGARCAGRMPPARCRRSVLRALRGSRGCARQHAGPATAPARELSRARRRGGAWRARKTRSAADAVAGGCRKAAEPGETSQA